MIFLNAISGRSTALPSPSDHQPVPAIALRRYADRIGDVPAFLRNVQLPTDLPPGADENGGDEATNDMVSPEPVPGSPTSLALNSQPVPSPVDERGDILEEEEEALREWCPLTLNEIADLIDNRPNITTRERDRICDAFKSYWLKVEGTVTDVSSRSVDIRMEDGFYVTLWFDDDYSVLEGVQKDDHFIAKGRFRWIGTALYRKASLEYCELAQNEDC